MPTKYFFTIMLMTFVYATASAVDAVALGAVKQAPKTESVQEQTQRSTEDCDSIKAPRYRVVD